MTRHFLTGEELSPDELRALIDRALELKAAPYSSDVLARRAVALIFQKPSTRTRVSFEAGVAELGGHPMILRTDDLQSTLAALLAWAGEHGLELTGLQARPASLEQAFLAVADGTLLTAA